MTLIDVARQLVADQFPDARAAVLAGSVAAGRATSTSDLDIVIVLAGPPAPYRETIRVEGTPVELFIHTTDSLTYWFNRERQEGRCTLAHMLATGISLAGEDTADIQAHAQRHVDEGPEPWIDDQVTYRRYALTDALDDLTGSLDADERDATAVQVLTMAFELALNTRRAWQGRGKWMVRQLQATEPTLTSALMAAHRHTVATGDPAELIAVCESILDEVGGRLTEGFHVS